MAYNQKKAAAWSLNSLPKHPTNNCCTERRARVRTSGRRPDTQYAPKTPYQRQPPIRSAQSLGDSDASLPRPPPPPPLPHAARSSRRWPAGAVPPKNKYHKPHSARPFPLTCLGPVLEKLDALLAIVGNLACISEPPAPHEDVRWEPVGFRPPPGLLPACYAAVSPGPSSPDDLVVNYCRRVALRGSAQAHLRFTANAASYCHRVSRRAAASGNRACKDTSLPKVEWIPLTYKVYSFTRPGPPCAPRFGMRVKEATRIACEHFIANSRQDADEELFPYFLELLADDVVEDPRFLPDVNSHFALHSYVGQTYDRLVYYT